MRSWSCILVTAILASPLFADALAVMGGAKAETYSGLQSLKAEYRRPAEIPAPADNAYSRRRADLGKMLFFDPRLSGSGALSCASCHNPALAWADGLKTGIGHLGSHLARHTPTIENLAWGEPLFWDGRAATLEDQAKGPLQAEAEMNRPLSDVALTVRAYPGYRAAFAAAYPGETITIDTIAKAMANFERTVVSAKAPFDRWIAGDERAISENAKRGFVVFNTKARCAVCHQGWRFTDDGFHDIGVNSDDMGRGRLVKGIVPLEHAFKTPTLRNVARRPPYMHDRSEKSLSDVVDFYSDGFIRRPSLSTDMKELNLSREEKKQLVDFLETLTSDSEPVTLPALPSG